MHIVSNIKIGARLACGFGLVLACALALLFLGLWDLSQSQLTSDDIVNERFAGLIDAMDMRETGNAIALSLRKIANPSDAEEGKRETQNLELILASYAKAEEDLKHHIGSTEGKAAFEAAGALKNELLPIVDKSKTLLSGNKYMAGKLLVQDEFLPLHEKWMASLGKLAQRQRDEARAAHADAKANYERTQLGMIAIGTLMMALGICIAWYITGTIIRPLRDAARVADTISSGDLTAGIEAKTSDEAGQLIGSLKRMQTNLAEIVDRIKSSADTISTGSSRIASGNAELSARTQRQAAALEATASSMEELTDTVRKNADNAQQASRMVNSASACATRGGQVVDQVVQTMGSIKESSRRIADITSVIDGIAFQTNILALNAAVEAARAGEQGRGFAVVAAEVRALAQRSASAAKEIKALIGNSVEQVDAGGKLVDDAGKTMNEIVRSVEEVACIMHQISDASREQSSGIQVINDAIVQMDRMTQQNADLVERAATEAQSMQDEAGLLVDAVSAFRLEQGPGDDIVETPEEVRSASPQLVLVPPRSAYGRQKQPLAIRS